jgi:hypothetical protein
MKGELERTCDTHEDRWDCGDNVVHFNEEKGTYGLMIRDGGRSTYVVNYCPWCGKDLQTVEGVKERVADLLREGLKGFIGQPNTEETRKAALLVAGVQVGTIEGFKPTDKKFENIHEIGKEPTTFTGVDLGKPGSEYTIVSEGHFDEDGKLIITSQKVTYPEGGPLVAEDIAVAFEKVEASEKNAKRVLGVLAAFDEEDKKS